MPTITLGDSHPGVAISAGALRQALRRASFGLPKFVHHGPDDERAEMTDGWFRRAVIATGIAVPVVAAVIWMRADNPPMSTVMLQTPNAAIRVEVADTPRARSAGLSRREALGDVDGLLLQWDASGRHPIWMAEMRFPLDLIWLDADGRVLALLENVPPCRASPCPLYEPEGGSSSTAVLELPASAARVRGIVVGARVRSLADARQRPE